MIERSSMHDRCRRVGKVEKGTGKKVEKRRGYALARYMSQCKPKLIQHISKQEKEEEERREHRTDDRRRMAKDKIYEDERDI